MIQAIIWMLKHKTCDCETESAHTLPDKVEQRTMCLCLHTRQENSIFYLLHRAWGKILPQCDRERGCWVLRALRHTASSPAGRDFFITGPPTGPLQHACLAIYCYTLHSIVNDTLPGLVPLLGRLTAHISDFQGEVFHGNRCIFLFTQAKESAKGFVSPCTCRLLRNVASVRPRPCFYSPHTGSALWWGLTDCSALGRERVRERQKGDGADPPPLPYLLAAFQETHTNTHTDEKRVFLSQCAKQHPTPPHQFHLEL